jgi:glycosyltransferase involved in cell wall biosynthesis
MTGVSYIVTAYNKAPYLPAVLEAIFKQEGDFERELIVVDDGSDDDSLAVCRAIAAGHDNFTVITQPNAGPAIATNKGASMARLEWLKGVDGDDLLAPWSTRLLIEAAERLGTDVAFGTMVEYDADTGTPFTGSKPPGEPVFARRDALPWLLYKPQFNLSQAVIRRDAFEQVGGCDEDVFVQDYSVTLRLAHRGPFAALDIPVCAAPLGEPGRLSEDVSKMLADANKALFHFVRDTPDLSTTHRWFAARRAAGRSWKWQHRHADATAFSRHYLRYMGAYLPVPALWISALAGAAESIAPDK